MLFSLALIIAFLGVYSCTKSKQKKEEVSYTPIEISLTVILHSENLEQDSLIDMDFVWKTGSNFENPQKKLKAYVHFSDPSGNIIFQDDHFPFVPITDWTTSSVNKYKRTIYCPITSYNGEILLFAGLYDSENCIKRYEVSKEEEISPEKFKGDIIRKKLSLLPMKEGKKTSSNRVIFKEGWNEQEKVKGDEWRWSKDRAILTLDNLGSDCILFINGWSDPKFLKGGQKITLKMGDWSSSASSDLEGYIVNKFIIPKTAFSEEDSCDIEITVEQSFIPVELGISEDYRTLGFMLRRIYFGPSE